jgi:ABC-type dipeptide/oligopeptide/nickel transport system permease subunit
LETRKKNQSTQSNKLFRDVLRINSKVFGLALGLVCGLVIFFATNWLVIKGGDQVGPHLSLLGQYFIGYRVSFFGSLIGLAYGFALGTLFGTFIGWIYNKIVALRNLS